MTAAFEDLQFSTDSSARTINACFKIVNPDSSTWQTTDEKYLGWQIYDPETGTFIMEGEWRRLGQDVAPGRKAPVQLAVTLPAEKGRYHVYISRLEAGSGWAYQKGEPFLLIDAAVEHGQTSLIEARVTTLRSMRRRKLLGNIGTFFKQPLKTLFREKSLIRSMVRRDLRGRYRGSAGDMLWTVLHPLLLIATYFFVFGIVLQSRFGADQSRTGFALYFLCGMLPWLAISEALGRAPHVILEHRNFVKKLVFPIEVLPVTQVFTGVVTQAFATAIFIITLFVIRGEVPWMVLATPVILVPQVLFTLGLAWALSSLGVYLRDLGQIIGFILTLWFFLTPICYPESSLPPEVAPVLTKNPVYALVSAYRTMMLEGEFPSLSPLIKLWSVGAVFFLFGHACFYKLRKSFVDVI